MKVINDNVMPFNRKPKKKEKRKKKVKRVMYNSQFPRPIWAYA